MGLLTGFIEGAVAYDDGGNVTLLPFGDTIEEAEFSYEGELLFSETFSKKGIKGASAACFFKESASFMLKTTNITWSFLQASMAQRDELRASAIPVVESVVLTGTATFTATLEDAPVVGTQIQVADLEGNPFTATFTGSTVTVTGAGVAAGKRVVVRYQRATAGERSIEIGKAAKIKENSVYGRFYGCPDEYVIVANRTVIKPSLKANVGSKPAEASMELTCLRDDLGVFASIIQIKG